MFIGHFAVALAASARRRWWGALVLLAVAFVAFLLVIYVANVFGPPPPSVAAVAWSAQAIWLLVAWGYWIDRHRIFDHYWEVAP